ncbi:MAG TPA: dihydrofolate reductase family protein [Rubrobacteraceae bacterium]|nr:dihydrofolate reductase family protein [Rubrobacteraceae bacterium]
MGKIALSQSYSLDGVMQAPGGPDEDRRGGFEHGGWAMDFDFNYGEGVGLEQAQNCEALLLGRVTYEVLQAYWPTREGQLADRLNELPKYVVSSTLTDPAWNATVLGEDWPEEVARLRKELDGEIVVYGSRRLSQALIGMGLVDELRLMVYPLVLGSGARLFGETQDKIPLRLVESRPLGGGVVSMIYAPAMAGG